MTSTPPTYSEQLAALVAVLLPDAGEAERLELLGAMDEGDLRTSMAFILTMYPSVFDHSLVRDRALVERLQERLDHQYDDDPEPYCTACGADLGIFAGRQAEGWLHYRGEGTVAAPVQIFEAGHEAVVAWREAGAGATLPRVRCMRVVWTDDNPEPCGLPVDHDPDEKCPGNPHARPGGGTSSESGAQ